MASKTWSVFDMLLVNVIVGSISNIQYIVHLTVTFFFFKFLPKFFYYISYPFRYSFHPIFFQFLFGVENPKLFEDRGPVTRNCGRFLIIEYFCKLGNLISNFQKWIVLKTFRACYLPMNYINRGDNVYSIPITPVTAITVAYDTATGNWIFFKIFFSCLC